MNDSFRCPNCEKVYPLKEGLAGRRVKCAGCGHVFRVSAAEAEPTPLPKAPTSRPASPPPGGAYPFADRPNDSGSDSASLPPAAKLRPVKARRKARSKRPDGGSAGDLSDRGMAWIQVGGGIILFGAISLVLPMFGLQFRKMAKLNARLGDNAWMGGVGTIVFGLIIIGIVLFRREIALTFKYAVRGVLVLIGMGVIVMMLVRAGLIGSRRRLPPAPMPRAAAPGRAFLGRPNFAGPRGEAERPLWVAPPVPAGFDAPERQLERMRARFGPGRVARLRIKGAGDLDVRSSLFRRLESLHEPGTDWSVRTSRSFDQLEVILAPVIDLESLSSKIDFGTVLEIDRPERIITVAVDRLKLRSP